jgi:hypothetical protein
MECKTGGIRSDEGIKEGVKGRMEGIKEGERKESWKAKKEDR